MLAILTRATAAVVSTVLGEAEVRLVEPGEGAGALPAAARIPADPLLLDVAMGPGLGPAVLRYRLARLQTRVVLLALGRSPGDAEVAGVVQAGVYDVVTEAPGSSETDPRTVGEASLSTRWQRPRSRATRARLDGNRVGWRSAWHRQPPFTLRSLLRRKRNWTLLPRPPGGRRNTSPRKQLENI